MSTDNSQTRTVGCPVSSRHILRDLARCAALLRDGSQGSGRPPDVEVWLQEHCELPIPRNRKQLARPNAKGPSLAAVDPADKDLARIKIGRASCRERV